MARCRACREALGKCRYCQHYDSRLLDCTNPSREPGDHLLDADAVLNCPEFESTLAASPLPRLPWALLRTAVCTAAVALLIMYGMVRFYQRPARPLPPVLLKASISTPGVSFRESGFDVTVLVQNKTDDPARDVQVSIRGPSISHLTCQEMRPPDAYMESAPTSVCAWLGDIPPGEIRSVTLHFLATRAGELDLNAYITAANLDAVQKIPVEGEVVP